MSTSTTQSETHQDSRTRVLDTSFAPPTELLTKCVRENIVTITIRDTNNEYTTIHGTVTGGEKIVPEENNENDETLLKLFIDDTQESSSISTATVSVTLGSIIDITDELYVTTENGKTKTKHVDSLEDVKVKQDPTLVIDMISGGGIKPSSEVSFQAADSYDQSDWESINVDGWWLNDQYPAHKYPASAYTDETVLGKIVFYARNNVDPEYEWFVDPQT